jgi:hypothetical protein
VEHVVASLRQSPVAPSVGPSTLFVVATVDLDNEPYVRCVEVDDEAPEHGYLPVEPDAQALAADGLEQASFRRGRSVPHLGCTK